MRILNREISEKKLSWLLMTPSLVVILGLNLYPIAYSFWISLRDMTLTRLASQRFVGLQNYITILQSHTFWSSMGITAYFTAVSLVAQLMLGMIIALVLNEKFCGRGLVRAIVIIPWAIPTVVNGAMWEWIFNSNYGALNGLLQQMNLAENSIQWLGQAFRALNMVILADTWKMVPFCVILLLAGLQMIPGTLYEAARIDGASFFRRLRSVTIPQLRSIILVILVLRTMQTFRVFDIIYIMTRGGPASGTMAISFFIYQETFGNMKFGYGSAMSFLVTIAIFIMALVYIRLLRSDEE